MMDKEQIRDVIEDAIARAAEAGWTIAEVREEVDYAIQTCAEEGSFGPAEEVRD